MLGHGAAGLGATLPCVAVLGHGAAGLVPQVGAWSNWAWSLCIDMHSIVLQSLVVSKLSVSEILSSNTISEPLCAGLGLEQQA